MIAAVRATGRLWPLLLALTLAVAGAARALAAPACEPEEAYRTALVTAPTEEASPTLVPVVIHFMERRGSGTEPECSEVRQQMTVAKLRVLFDSDVTNAESVNSVWTAVGTKFFIRAVFVRGYNAPSALQQVESNGVTVVKFPPQPPDKDWEKAFDDFLTEFHQPKAINLYLWPLVPLAKIGFGRSLSAGLRATVWLGSACIDPEVETDCARRIAHELGHALGLYHVKLDEPTDPCDALESSVQRAVCQVVTAPCEAPPPDPGKRLMAQGAHGIKLCPAEGDEAKRVKALLK